MLTSRNMLILACILIALGIGLLLFGTPIYVHGTAASLGVAMFVTGLLQLQHERHMQFLREHERALHDAYVANLSTPRADVPRQTYPIDDSDAMIPTPPEPAMTASPIDSDDDGDGPGFVPWDDEGSQQFGYAESARSEDPDGYMVNQGPISLDGYASSEQREPGAVTKSPGDIDSPEIDPSTALGPFSNGTRSVNQDGSTTEWEVGNGD